MYLKNKGVVDTHAQSITDINNNDVNLIEIESIKKDSGFPSDTVNKSAFLIIYDKDKDDYYFYILIDEIGREYYLRTNIAYDIKNARFLLTGEQVLDRWWSSIAMEGDPTHSYFDIRNMIVKTSPAYNADEINKMIDGLEEASEESRYFKRTGTNNVVDNIHQAHQFPKINTIDPVIRFTVQGRHTNTDYRIWYHNWQGGWEDALVMAAWGNVSITEMRFGMRSDYDSEDIDIQHNVPSMVVRHRENGNIHDKEVLMNFHMQWKHFANAGPGQMVRIPDEAVDAMVIPRFISCLDLDAYWPLPVGRSKSERWHPNGYGGVVNINVPIGYNPFIGRYFDFDLPCFLIPAGLDYGLHGSSYSLIARSNREITFNVGNRSHVAHFGRFRNGAINNNAPHPYYHYEVWWR